jgi:hypothetical protein
MIDKRENLPERNKTVDAFFNVSNLQLACSVTMFYLTVVLKKETLFVVVSILGMMPNLSYNFTEDGPIVCRIHVPSMRVLNLFPISS